MNLIIDCVATLGAALIVAGIYLQFGLAASLIVSGSLLVAFALKAAKVQEESNVSNS